MSDYTAELILSKFSNLFLLCKILGLYPHNLQSFQQCRELKKSTIGTLFVILCMILIVISFNLLIYSIWDMENATKRSQSALTFVMTLLLSYIGLVMVCTDQLNAIRNQNRLGQLYDRIRTFDEQLLREGCWIDNTKLQTNITVMVSIVFICEITIILSTYIFLLDYSQLKSLLWIASCFPTLYNSLDKIWFAVTLKALKYRFSEINRKINEMVDEYEGYHMSSSDYKRSCNRIEYPKNELTDLIRYKKSRNRILPIEEVASSFNNFNNLSKNNFQEEIVRESHLHNVIKAEKKLYSLCQLNDELCEIGKILNELWNFPILALMAYGFLIFTSQLYFLYCAMQGQGIPSLFLSAKNFLITALVLIYTGGKCSYLFYLSWKTSLESNGIGICVHKCGFVVDNNDFYEIINSLSLKLLYHSSDFTAYGYFALNMETLYGICGAITTYLIITIQFNLAGLQAQEAMRS